MDKIGLPTLVELPRPRSSAGRARQERRLGQLANIARARLAGPGVVAVAQPEDGHASSVVARKLALEWARQGYPTVLVNILAPTFAPGEQHRGTLDSAEAATPQLRPGRVPALSILDLAPQATGTGPLLTISKITELLEQEALAGHYVLFDAPALVRSSAAQAICHAADQTILVVDTEVSRVAVTREAVAVLRQMGARVMGVVVATVRKDQGREAVVTAAAAPVVTDAPLERATRSTTVKA
jgi:Mrp family chromosome partitioning ATPase